MRILLDRNRYTHLARGEAAAVDCLQRATRAYVPFVVLGELRAGFLCGTRSQRNEANLTRFLAVPRVDVLYADDEATHHSARLFRQLRAQRTPVPTNDLRIAALAVQHGLHLFARDRHFDHLPQVPRA